MHSAVSLPNGEGKKNYGETTDEGSAAPPPPQKKIQAEKWGKF
jgi:hypothetical protein